MAGGLAGLPRWALGSLGVPTKPDGGEACGLRRVAAAGPGSGRPGPAHLRAGDPGDDGDLAERLSHQELARLRAWLPDELQAAVDAGSPARRPFDADEFVGRVAERVGAQPQVAWTHVRAVLGTLDREVAQMQVLRQRLPRDFDALLA